MVGTGVHVFTVRDEDEERRLFPVGSAENAEVIAYVTVIAVRENPRRLGVKEWLERMILPPVTVNWRVSGRPAVRMELSRGSGIQTVYVARDDDVVEAGPSGSNRPEWLPAGWVEQKLKQDIQQIIDSLELTR